MTSFSGATPARFASHARAARASARTPSPVGDPSSCRTPIVEDERREAFSGVELPEQLGAVRDVPAVSVREQDDRARRVVGREPAVELRAVVRLEPGIFDRESCGFQSPPGWRIGWKMSEFSKSMTRRRTRP